MKLKSSFVTHLALLALSAGPINAATVLYSTDFNSLTYSDGGLIGQDSWLITGTSVVSPISVANTATNGTVTLATTGQDVNRVFAPASTTDSIFLKADITVATAAATGDYFMHLGDGGTTNFFARTYIKSSGTGFVMAVGTSSGTGVTYGAELAFSTTYTLLIRYDFVSGAGNDTGALFINPLSPEGLGDTPYVALTTIGIDAASISSVNLRQGTAANAPGVTIDNIVVSVIPEPASAFLGAFGLLGLLRRRR